MTAHRNTGDSPPSRGRPATTPEARENQMISLAVDLAEKQLREGTASAQVMSHYLKLATSRERLEQEKLALEKDLIAAKVEAIARGERMEELVGGAIEAFRSYVGQGDDYDQET